MERIGAGTRVRIRNQRRMAALAGDNVRLRNENDLLARCTMGYMKRADARYRGWIEGIRRRAERRVSPRVEGALMGFGVGAVVCWGLFYWLAVR